MRHATDRRGFITVEAAIVLPVFLLAVIAMGYYIKVFGIMENVSYSMMDEASRAAANAYTVKVSPLLGKTVHDRIISDCTDAEGLRITEARYLYNDGDLDGMISLRAEYHAGRDLPMDMGAVTELVTQIKCRGFTGTENAGTPMPFEEMEKEGVWDPVWIFPSDGEKYHGENCTYVTANARELVLTTAVKRKFAACKLCGAAEVPDGSYVYCFMENGEVYHKPDCRQVSRFTIEISRSEAIDKGYTPCSKCGGV